MGDVEAQEGAVDSDPDRSHDLRCSRVYGSGVVGDVCFVDLVVHPTEKRPPYLGPFCRVSLATVPTQICYLSAGKLLQGVYNERDRPVVLLELPVRLSYALPTTLLCSIAASDFRRVRYIIPRALLGKI